MNPEKFQELMGKLSSLLKEEGVNPSVSPTTRGGIQPLGADTVFISKGMNLDLLNKNTLLLIHVLLHKFYATGTKNLTKEDIKDLHEQIKTKINHHYFDRLDS